MKSVSISLNGYDFNLIIKRCSDAAYYYVEEDNIRFILKGQVIKITSSNGLLHINYNLLSEQEVVEEIIYRFGLDLNKEEVAEYFKDTEWNRLIEISSKYAEIYHTDLLTSFITSIIHQLVSMKAAYSITKKFMMKFGNKVEDLYAFPTADDLINITLDDLSGMGLTMKKAETIIKIIEDIKSGNLILNDLKDMEYNDIYIKLISYKGIGNWTIDNIVLFGLRYNNAWPYKDIGLQEGYKKYLNLDIRPSDKEMKSIGDKIGKFKSHLTIKLWYYNSLK